MHIAYVTDQILPQTATDTEQLVTMSAALGDTGSKVTIITPSHWFKEDCDRLDIARYYYVNPSFQLLTLKGAVPSIRGVEKIVHAVVSALSIRKLEEIDLVYTRNLPIVIAFLLLSRKKIVYETYRPWPDQNILMIPLFQWFLRSKRVKGLILHSKLAAESYQIIGFGDDKLLVAHNGVDLSRFQSGLTKEEARERLRWDPDKTIITYTGRVNKDKGLDIMLRLAREFRHVHFVIVGSERGGEVEREAASLENVFVYPWQSIEAVPAFLLASDILFIPPTAKPLNEVGNTVLPMKTFIYLASGRAIIGPQISDLQEVLSDQENALLVPPDNYDSLIDSLQKLLDDRTLQKKLGAQAKADSKRYSWRNRAERVVEFINNRD